MKDAPPSWGTNIFVPRDVSFQALDYEMDEADKEIKGFKKFCFMSKTIVNHPKVTLKEYSVCTGYWHIKLSLIS